MPPEISLCHLSYNEWYNKHRINHNNWKIADIDNSINGNSFFTEEIPSNKYEETFESRAGHFIKEWDIEKIRIERT